MSSAYKNMLLSDTMSMSAQRVLLIEQYKNTLSNLLYHQLPLVFLCLYLQFQLNFERIINFCYNHIDCSKVKFVYQVFTSFTKYISRFTYSKYETLQWKYLILNSTQHTNEEKVQKRIHIETSIRFIIFYLHKRIYILSETTQFFIRIRNI